MEQREPDPAGHPTNGARRLLIAMTLIACALLQPALLRAQQESAVAGVVVDAATGQPIGDVQIGVAGTQLGARSDAAGRFQITGVTGTTVTLRATRIGYRALATEVPAGSRDVRLLLEAVPLQLDATVVTGAPAGIQKRSIGNVVENINAEAVVGKAPVSTLGELLNARAPGVQLQNISGIVGAGPRIRIRGPGSLTLSSEPLLYIDGLRVDNSVGTGPGALVSRLNDIDPSTIESIEIIKGPAAATLYGTEASSGVIQVITKKGVAGSGSSLGVTVRQGANWFMNAEDRFPDYYWRNPESGDVMVANLLTLERERGTPVFGTGHVREYGLDVRGGSDAISYYAQAGYADNTGIEPTNSEKRVTGRANLGLAPHHSVDVAISQGIVIGRTKLAAGTDGSSVVDEALWGGLSLLDGPTRGFLSAPPEAVWAATERSLDVNRYTGSVVLNHRPTSWFTQRLTTGVDISDENGAELTPRMGPDIAQFYSPFTASGSKFVDRRTSIYTTLDYSGTASWHITPALTSSSSLGGQFYRKGTRFEHLEGRNFPAAGIKTIEGAAQRLGSDDYLQNSTVGVFVQQQFAWRERLFITAALRGDDNSAFGENFDFVTYPKLSATWVLSDEPFWNLSFVDALKLRAAYGASGKQPDAFAAVRTFAPRPASGGAAAVTPQSIGNPDLGPERSTELEIGFDAGMLDGRLSANLTYFRNNTTDAILLRETAPSFGFPGAQYVNAGATRSSGFELQLTGQAVRSERFELDLAASLSTNDSKVLDLGDQSFIPKREIGGYKPGYPVDAFFGKRVVSAAFDGDGNAIDILCDGGPGAAAMDCDDAPRVYLGRETPRYLGSVSSTATFLGKIRLYALVDFQGGHRKFNKEWWNRCPWGIEGNCPERVYPERFDVRRIAETQIGDIGTSSTAFESGSFAKLREISLSYTLPTDWAGRIGAKRASLSVAGRNLHTWTKYTGFDPEGLSTEAYGASRWGDQGAIPQLAQFLTTINVTF
jgi:TonB-linked SusC/RagA family outer membrane protein